MPTMAAKRNDVETVLSVLEREVGKEHKIGLEIIGLARHFQNPESIAEIVKNINELAKGAYVSVHGFSGMAVYESGLADMRSEESGGKLLDIYLDIANKTNAQYVHVHSGAGYKGITNAPKNKSADLQKIKNVMLARANKTSIPVGIENLPAPSMGDMEKDPDQIWCDEVESIDDCLDVVKGTNMKVTFDTCHHACGLNGQNIDVVEPAMNLGKHAGYFHLSDVDGNWVPYESIWTEGVVPGKGRIGEQNFMRFIKYIKSNHPDAKLCIEANNKDFSKLDESAESIKRVVNWLK